jgi:hypothetical protein
MSFLITNAYPILMIEDAKPEGTLCCIPKLLIPA